MFESRVCAGCAHMVLKPHGEPPNMGCKKMVHMVTGDPAPCVIIRLTPYETEMDRHVYSSSCNYQERQWNVCGTKGHWWKAKDDDNNLPAN
jgi:hypothetical protein